ncbi:Probable E3 ubiquitin-protein ligase HERC4 [Seminavis robusta]|uniref:HECT-type E3 ubiquitin transferase n=1 Tax=Seminavis robusta TaxID=568900 RepID=A0A9N8DXE9_9STRA|nr:Probable E3 ubiquitin-protein ligase HERC4 [Seminavis robusta]|eukprot:Sro439_g143220.1 Probable E3 ubiquitin-protein ligase HERC4 (681) ;mRNA; f:33640-35766
MLFNRRRRENVPIATASTSGNVPEATVAEATPQRNEESTEAQKDAVIRIPRNARPGAFFSTPSPDEGVILKVKCPDGGQPGQMIKVKWTPPQGRCQGIVIIPSGIQPGATFMASHNGNKYRVTCPPNAQAGSKLRILLGSNMSPKGKTRWVAATAPSVEPEEDLMWTVDGCSVLVRNASASVAKEIRFQFPSSLSTQPAKTEKAWTPTTESWQRLFHVNDENFQWHRVSDQDKRNQEKCFVPRLNKGTLELVPVKEAVGIQYSFKDPANGQEIANYEDVLHFQRKHIKAKHDFLQNLCSRLLLSAVAGASVRRSHFLEDSMNIIMGLPNADIERWWKVRVVNQPGQNESGGTRAWIQELIEKLMDPNLGMWKRIGTSAEFEPDPSFQGTPGRSWEDYYIVFGRAVGRAFVLGYPLPTLKCSDLIYKYLSGYPLGMNDLRKMDASLHTSLTYFQALSDENELEKFLAMSLLTFSLPAEAANGGTEDIPLVPGGATKKVTVENFQEFHEAVFRHCLLERVRPQLQALVAGFRSVLPDENLSWLLQPDELQVCLGGFPSLGVEEWKSLTFYRGEFSAVGDEHPQIRWFWQMIHEMDYMTKVKMICWLRGVDEFVVHRKGLDVFGHRFGVTVTRRGTGGTKKYPFAGGCHLQTILEIPMFQSVEEMKRAFVFIISTCTDACWNE